MKPAVTVVITTYNESRNIAECIESARLLTPDVIVVDTESTDNTVEIARRMKVPVHTFPFAHYVEPSRGFSIKQASGDWVFILDADERITPALAAEIMKSVADAGHTYYKVPRKELFARRVWLRHGGWWPNHQIRLINRGAFKSWPERIHSTPVIAGIMGFLTEPLLHYSKNDYAQIVEKTIVFEDVESKLLYEAGRQASVPVFFRKYFGELWRRLVKRQGYRDGGIGIIESVYQAYSKTITYIYLYEKKKGSSVRPVS